MEALATFDLAQPWSDWSEYEGLMGENNTPYKAIMLTGLAGGKVQCLDIINHDGVCSLKRYEQDGAALREVILTTDAEKLDFLRQLGGWLKAEDAWACEVAVSEVLAFNLVPVKLETYIRSRTSDIY